MSSLKLIAILITLSALALLVPAALAQDEEPEPALISENQDPGSLFVSFIGALNAGNADAAVELFADDAVFTVSFGPQSEVFTGKEEIRLELQEPIDTNTEFQLLGPPQVQGDSATAVVSFTDDDLQRLGVDIEATFEITVQEGKITALTLTASAESLQRIGDAVSGQSPEVVAAQEQAFEAAARSIRTSLENSSGTVLIRDSDKNDFSDELSAMAAITITGAPAPPEAAAYEGWFVSDDGSRKISTGILQPDSEGNINQTFMLTEEGTRVTFTSIETPEGPRFSGPDSLSAGWTVISHINRTFQPHVLSLIRLPDDKTLEDLGAVLQQQPIGAPLPPWAKFSGGLSPEFDTTTTTATINLVEGTYVALDPLPGQDGVPNFAKGMVKPFTVTATTTPSRPEPEADLTIDISDSGFSLSTPLIQGIHTIRINNVGSQPHDAGFSQPLGSEASDVLSAISALLSGNPSDDFPGRSRGGLATIDAGDHAFITAEFDPGAYVVFSGYDLAQDPSSSMFQELTIEAQPVGLGVNEVTYDALDTPEGHIFSGSDSVPAGWTSLVLNNSESQEPHILQLIQLLEDKTAEDFLASLEQEDEPLPPWAVPSGGPGFTPPGETINTTVNILEGSNYVMVCLIEGQDGIPHFAKGMWKTVSVTAAPDPLPPEPEADIIIDVSNTGITTSEPITRGTHTIRINNVSINSRIFDTIRLAPGTSGPGRGATSAGGTTGIAPGDHAYITTNFVAGNYFFFSFPIDVPPGPEGPAPIQHLFSVEGTPTGENLFADFDKFVVTIEPVPDRDPGTSDQVAYIHAIPTGALAHIRHLLFSWTGNPSFTSGFHEGIEKGITVGLREQTWAALVHARLSASSDTIEDARLHACHVVNIIEGTGDGKGENFDASCGNFGDGFGVLSYAVDSAKHAEFASGQAPDNQVIVTNANKVVNSSNAVTPLATQARDLALQAARSTDLLAARISIQNAEAALMQALDSSKAAYMAAQDMGAHTLMPQAIEKAVPPATGDTSVPNLAWVVLILGAFLLVSGVIVYRRSVATR